jgi:hypothetical protein
LQWDGSDIVLDFRVTGGAMRARLTFDADGSLLRSQCGLLQSGQGLAIAVVTGTDSWLLDAGVSGRASCRRGATKRIRQRRQGLRRKICGSLIMKPARRAHLNRSKFMRLAVIGPDAHDRLGLRSRTPCSHRPPRKYVVEVWQAIYAVTVDVMPP